MATIVFAAAGAALGAGFGGSVIGLSGAVIGRAVGASLGRAIDQRIMGNGSGPVEVGKIDRFQVMGASEGAPVSKSWGRTKLPGQVIWASPFREQTQKSGGKGMPSAKTINYSYSVSLAIAICEGEILGLGRVWADGDQIKISSINLRVYNGTKDQLPDPLLEASLGAGLAPAYRGIAYVVIENLQLSEYGNRVPQFSFEVMRRAQGEGNVNLPDLQDSLRAVALIPGTGEYSLATNRVREFKKFGTYITRNVSGPSGDTDFVASLKQLEVELPNCNAVSLVVSWFGNDLRCSFCDIKPKVESKGTVETGVPWMSGGILRNEAVEVPKLDGRSVYGGTPADSAVIDAITALREAGKKVMFYPFILMDQLAENELPDPYSEEFKQPTLPWRGRVTLSVAPGNEASPDTTQMAVEEVAAFFGTAVASDFIVSGGKIHYNGPPEWSYRRFILHYAILCKLSGGVESFCIGSEMRGVTSIRGPEHTFPAVAALVQLAIEVKGVLGSETKVSYAADWSEYFGHHVDGNVYFNLDPLWSCNCIDFIGIDNYMPISDWRKGEQHIDSSWKSIYSLEYLKSNIEGGEGFDWYYADDEGRHAQARNSIVDTAFGEDWIFKYKDIRSWWSNAHHDRVEGLRCEEPTAWIPQSKPIRFTEFGCPAIDFGTNEPNKFFDEKSSESALPRFSSGIRDDLIQMQYFIAIVEYWSDPEINPRSTLNDELMINIDFCYAWAWDARPYPEFPRNTIAWSDGENYDRGHWLNGRASSVPLCKLVTEVCGDISPLLVDTDRLFGSVHGYYLSSGESPRSILQSLATLYFFDCFEADGLLTFRSKGQDDAVRLDLQNVVLRQDLASSFEATRSQNSTSANLLRFTYLVADDNFPIGVAEVGESSCKNSDVIEAEFPVVMPRSFAKGVAKMMLEGARVAREGVGFQLPLSLSGIDLGAIVNIGNRTYKIDRREYSQSILVKATAFDRSIHSPAEFVYDSIEWENVAELGPIGRVWLDLPFIGSTKSVHSPYLAIFSEPWRGPAVLWSSGQDADYQLNATFHRPSHIGETEDTFNYFSAGLVDHQSTLRIRMFSGELSSSTLYNSRLVGNLLAISDEASGHWELFQFFNVNLISQNVYEVSTILRGQFGTEVDDGFVWPSGSRIVVVNQDLEQISLRPEDLNAEVHFRLGFSENDISSDDVVHDVVSFSGVGLRPLSVVHLRVVRGDVAQHSFSWIRRARIGADSWDGLDVPLGEDLEQYLFVVLSLSGEAIYQTIVDRPFFVLSSDERVSRGLLGSYVVEVSQLSVIYGAGRKKRLIVV